MLCLLELCHCCLFLCSSQSLKRNWYLARDSNWHFSRGLSKALPTVTLPGLSELFQFFVQPRNWTRFCLLFRLAFAFAWNCANSWPSKQVPVTKTCNGKNGKFEIRMFSSPASCPSVPGSLQDLSSKLAKFAIKHFQTKQTNNLHASTHITYVPPGSFVAIVSGISNLISPSLF